MENQMLFKKNTKSRSNRIPRKIFIFCMYEINNLNNLNKYETK